MEETGTVVQPALRRRKPRTVTLQPGSWIFICPCGFPYQVMHVSRLTLDAVTLPMTKLDSGLLPEEFRRRFRENYRNRPGIDWAKQQVDFIVMEYLIDSKEPSLFK